MTQRCRDNKPGLIEAFIQRHWNGRHGHHGYGVTATASTTTPLVLEGAAPPNASSETNTERRAAPNLLGSSATPNDNGTHENDSDDVEDATTTDTMLDVFSKYQPNEAMTLYVLITGYLQGDHETPYLWAAYGLCQILAPVFYAHTAGPDLQYYQLFGTSVYFCLWSIILGGPFLTLASYDHVKKIITAFVIPILSTLLTVYKDPIDTICGNSVNKEDASHRAPN